MATVADSLQIAIVREVAPGQTPAAPAFDVVPATGEGLALNITTGTSGQVGGDVRAVRETFITGAEVAGAVNFELSMCDAVEKLFAGMMGADWQGDDLVVGSAVQTFTVEKRLTVDVDTFTFQRFRGCVVSSLSLTLAPNVPITGAVQFVGAAQDLASEAIEGATYNPVPDSPVMQGPGVDKIALIDLETGEPFAWVGEKCFTSLSLNFNNNARGRPCLGHLGARDAALGRLEIALPFSVYFSDVTLHEMLVAQEAFGLEVQTTAADGAAFLFSFPRCRIASVTNPASGPGADIVDTGEIAALAGLGAEPSPVKITRKAKPAAPLANGGADV